MRVRGYFSDRIFGETEIAQSIREMKEVDPNFRLSQMAEDIEHVVAPRIIRWYLEVMGGCAVTLFEDVEMAWYDIIRKSFRVMWSDSKPTVGRRPLPL